MPEYMYACHVSSTVTCQYYTSRTYYHNESPISFLPELFRIWPRDTRAISIRLCFSSIERYKIIRVYTLSLWKTEFPKPSSDKKGIYRVNWPRRNCLDIFCACYVRAHVQCVHIVCVLRVYCNHSWRIAIRISRPKQKKPRGERNTRFCKLANVVCNWSFSTSRLI